MSSYKTKKEYILDLELNPSENYSLIEIKKQYRLLTVKYHPDNGKQKNEEKFKTIAIAFDALENKKYKEKEGFSEFPSEEEVIENLSSKLDWLFSKIGTNINLNNKNIDSITIIVNNKIVNLEWKNLSKEGFLVFSDNRIFKFSKDSKNKGTK